MNKLSSIFLETQVLLRLRCVFVFHVWLRQGTEKFIHSISVYQAHGMCQAVFCKLRIKQWTKETPTQSCPHRTSALVGGRENVSINLQYWGMIIALMKGKAWQQDGERGGGHTESGGQEKPCRMGGWMDYLSPWAQTKVFVFKESTLGKRNEESSLGAG